MYGIPNYRLVLVVSFSCTCLQLSLDWSVLWGLSLISFFFFLSAVEKGYIVNREKSASGLGGLL